MNKKEILEDLKKCIKCGICQATCPTYKVSQDESMVARGRLKLIESLLHDDISYSGDFKKKFSTCLSCMSCTDTCPANINPAKIINEVKFIEKQGLDSDFFVKFLVGNVLESGWSLSYVLKYFGLIYRLAFERLPDNGMFAKFNPLICELKKKDIPEFKNLSIKKLFPEVIKPKGKVKKRVLFFTGCMTDFFFHESGISVIEILRMNHIEVLLPKDIFCCGAPVFYLGDRKSAKKIAQKNISIINSFKIDAVIVNCATCGSMMLNNYKDLLGESVNKVPVVDVNKFLVENSNILKYDKCENKNEKILVTYHDPCHLKKGQGVFEEPREILKSIPGVRFVEMKDSDFCCGGAGLFSVKNYKMALKIAQKKVCNIKASGAGIVATSCPSCKMHLDDAIKRQCLDIKVLHPLEIFNSFIKNKLK